jgi:MFS family permease
MPPSNGAFRVNRNLRLLYALGIVREFTPILAIWVVYLTDFRNLSLTQVGVMEGLFWAVKLALELPSGAFADRFGRRATFATGLSLEFFGTLIFAFAGDFTLLAVSYVIWSAGLAFRSGNDEAFLYDTLTAGGEEEHYSDRLGVYFALEMVSLLAGGLVGGVLAEVANLQVAVLAALVPLALAAPVVALMQEPPRRTHSGLSLLGTLSGGLSTVWKTRELRSILLLQIALTGVYPAFFLLSQPFLDAHDVPLALFGVVTIPILLANTGAGLISGRFTRRAGLPATLAVAIAGAVSGLTLLAVIDHVGAFAALAVARASVALAIPAIGAYVNERTESDVRATVLSIAPMGTSIMMAAMSAGSGAIAAQSLQLAFGVMALAIAMLAGFNYLAWLSAHPKTPPREVEVVEV